MSKNLSQGPRSLYHSLSWPSGTLAFCLSFPTHQAGSHLRLSAIIVPLPEPLCPDLHMASPVLSVLSPPRSALLTTLSKTVLLGRHIGETNVGHICDYKFFSSHIKIFSRGEILIIYLFNPLYLKYHHFNMQSV